jgi:dTDP-4-amino-4,6-dideoxygalactose transaminase
VTELSTTDSERVHEEASSKSLNAVREEFEKQIARYAGTRFAVACSSGRSAIRFSLLALGIGHDNEVVVPDFACQILPITVFCVGAVPKFCDINRKTLTLDSESLIKVLSPHTKAIIFAPLFGMPVDPSPILEIAEEKGISFIDDSAQALGTTFEGRKVGSFGDVGIYSFNKFLNVNLGGAAITNDEKLADRIKLYRAKYETKSILVSSGNSVLEFLGRNSAKAAKMIFKSDVYLYKLLNYKLSKKYFEYVNGWLCPRANVIEAWESRRALTTSMINQLMASESARSWHRRRLEKLEILSIQHEFENLQTCLEKRKAIAKIYEELLSEGSLSEIVFSKNSTSSYMRYPVMLSDKSSLSKCVGDLVENGFFVDYLYKPLHLSPLASLADNKLNFSESKYASDHVLPLPISLNMNPENAEKIASIVNKNLPVHN